MQIREQWKGSRNWKLVTGAATAATLGLGALAIAIPGGADDQRVWVFLDERAAASDQATAGDSVPLDLTFTGLHSDLIVHDNPYFGASHFWDTRPLNAVRPLVQAGSDPAPPVTDVAAGGVSDGVAVSDDEDETAADVLSDDVDATGDAVAEVTDDGVSDDGVMDDGDLDGPAAAVGDDPPADEPVSDAPDLGSDDSPDGLDDSPDGWDDSPDGLDDSPDGSDDSPDGSDDSPDGSDDSPDGSDDSPDDSDDSD